MHSFRNYLKTKNKNGERTGTVYSYIQSCLDAHLMRHCSHRSHWHEGTLKSIINRLHNMIDEMGEELTEYNQEKEKRASREYVERGYVERESRTYERRPYVKKERYERRPEKYRDRYERHPERRPEKHRDFYPENPPVFYYDRNPDMRQPPVPFSENPINFYFPPSSRPPVEFSSQQPVKRPREEDYKQYVENQVERGDQGEERVQSESCSRKYVKSE